MQDHTTYNSAQEIPNKKRNRKPRYESVTDAFWARVTPGNPEQCWLWPACTTQGGYGVFSHYRKIYYAHRVSYEIQYGSIPEGLDILHSCDTPACCNPHHLRAGTAKDNAQDMLARRRNRNKVFRGEQHSNAKLSESQVLEIRRLANENVPHQKIAEIYSISKITVSQIKCRRIWAHLE